LIVEVWGGAGEHGRSCYYIENNDRSILLDCGGMKVDGGIYPLLNPEKVRKLDAVFLSHAHEDHSAALPLLYKLGYKGKVWTSSATIKILPTYFSSWKSYVEQERAILPYTPYQQSKVCYSPIDYKVSSLKWTKISKDIYVCWGPSGHMLGAIWFSVEIAGKTVFFTGDYCQDPLLLNPVHPWVDNKIVCDVAVVDAAYGNKRLRQAHLLEDFITAIKRALERGGHVILPVPLFGRGQDLIILLDNIFPEITFAVEHELLTGITDYMNDIDWLKEEARVKLREMKSTDSFIKITNDSVRRQILTSDQQCIIFTPDGMLQSTQAKWYYNQIKNNPMHTIIFTGYLNEGSFGAKVKGRSDCVIDHHYLKVHQCKSDVDEMLHHVKAKQTLLVHATYKQTKLLCDSLKDKHYGMIALQTGDKLLIQ